MNLLSTIGVLSYTQRNKDLAFFAIFVFLLATFSVKAQTQDWYFIVPDRIHINNPACLSPTCTISPMLRSLVKYVDGDKGGLSYNKLQTLFPNIIIPSEIGNVGLGTAHNSSTALITFADGSTTTLSLTGEEIMEIPAEHSTKLIKSIKFDAGSDILIGRYANEDFELKIENGALAFRGAVNGSIPIGTVGEFAKISTALSGTYHLEADINMLGDCANDGFGDGSDAQNTDAVKWTPIGTFTGTFDGRGHKLYNLYVNVNGGYVGLFSRNSGLINGICIESGSITGSALYTSSICGGAETNGTISNCYNKAVISGYEYVGGICGGSNGSISGCYNTGNISAATQYVGGICGINNSGAAITNCYNTGSITASGSYVGGICGANGKVGGSGTTENCYNIGSVNGNTYVGGICGTSYSLPTNCFWFDVICDDATYGNGYNNNNDGATPFACPSAWPSWDAAIWDIPDCNTGQYPTLKVFDNP
jgi:hypothetical protein